MSAQAVVLSANNPFPADYADIYQVFNSRQQR